MQANPSGYTQAPRRLSIDELMSHGDLEFVRLAYRAILGREADEAGLATYVAQLREGKAKESIIHALASSSEAAQRKANLHGLEEFLGRPNASPGFFARWRASLYRRLGIEDLVRSVRIVDNHLYRIDLLLAKQGAEVSAVRAAMSVGAPSAPNTPAPAPEPDVEPDVSGLLSALREHRDRLRSAETEVQASSEGASSGTEQR